MATTPTPPTPPTPTPDPADILSNIIGQNNEEVRYLRYIADTLHTMADNQSRGLSMSNARHNQNRDSDEGSSHRGTSPQNRSNRGSRGNSNQRNRNRNDDLSGYGSNLSGFVDSLEHSLINELGGNAWRSALSGIRNRLANDMGVEISQLPAALGKGAGQLLFNSLRNSRILGEPINRFSQRINSTLSSVTDSFNQGYQNRINALHPLNYDLPIIQTDSDTSSTTNPLSGNDSQNNPSDSTPTNPIQNTPLTSQLSDIISAIRDDVSIIRQIQEGVWGSPNPPTNTPSNPDPNNPLSGLGPDPNNPLPITPDADLGNDIANGAATAETATATAEALESTLTASEGASAALGGLSTAVGPLVGGLMAILPEIIIVTGAIVVISKLLDGVIEGVKSVAKWLKTLLGSANRTQESLKKNAEAAQKRLEADVDTLVKKPFEILEQAATEWYNSWDNNLRVITATQGYNKEELQDLMSSFTQRLRDENLTNVVAASEIANNLTKVLESGLSGRVAEEFAYLATVLNNAIPTQDFFGYAETYASIAANAVRQGKSEADAIAYANRQLQTFANDLLYTSRELSGGFSTGLKNASDLFAKSAQIAQTSKTGTASDIASVMTVVSAITGAIAPELASSMTDVVYKAAVGGNESSIVALRSLAGVNASNTEFIKKLATDPKSIFVTLFKNLADYQNMSNDAFMEVAEGLSDVFGVSMDAFARIDFAYLAQAIDAMNDTSSALNDNIAHLQSGETTTNADLLKIQQINKYMLDEGLAYVLDNEAARAIQQHMWDEQMQRELQETTYAVELEGAAMTALTGLANAVSNILNFLVPFGKIANIVRTTKEQKALKADIADVLELGKVGTGNSKAKSNLVTRNKDLNLIDDYVSLLGGQSQFNNTHGYTEWIEDFLNWEIKQANLMPQHTKVSKHGVSESGAQVSSLYNWGLIGKSMASMLSSSNMVTLSSGLSDVASSMISTVEATQQSMSSKAQEQTNQNVDKWIGTMSDVANADRENTFEDWAKTASSFGIKDFETAVENAGYAVDDLKNQFSKIQTQIAAKEEQERKKREEKFWEDTVEQLNINNSWLETLNNTTTDLLTTNNTWLETLSDTTIKLQNSFKSFFDEWKTYYIDHTVYNSAFNSDTVNKVLRDERADSEAAVYALADALTGNDVKLLLDPTVQTNALLSQILKVVNALLVKSDNPAAGISLPDTLAGLSLGLIG